MFSDIGYFDSMADNKHIAEQLPSCCCFIIDKRHFSVATLFFFILPIFVSRKWKNARTWVESIIFSGQKTCALITSERNHPFNIFVRHQYVSRLVLLVVTIFCQNKFYFKTLISTKLNTKFPASVNCRL